MKVTFISMGLSGVSGSGVGARMHLDTLRRLVGDKNVLAIDVSSDVPARIEDNYVAYGKYKTKLERVKRHLQNNPYMFSTEIIADICNRVRNFDAGFVFVDNSIFGNLVKELKRRYPELPVVCFFHDVKAELYPIWMKHCSFISKVNYKIAIKNEEISTKLADKNLILNAAEDKLLEKYYGVRADYYLPVCVPKEAISSTDPYEQNGKRHILFVGTNYRPNIDAIHRIITDILPEVSCDYDFWVLGKGLEILREEYSNLDNVKIVGFAESLAPYYQFADVVVAPLRDGDGMKIKTAEAFSYGKIFIGSSESLHGYYENLTSGLKEKTVFQCDSSDEYVRILKELAAKKIDKCNQELVELYEKCYSPEAAYSIIKTIIEDCTGEKL